MERRATLFQELSQSLICDVGWWILFHSSAEVRKSCAARWFVPSLLTACLFPTVFCVPTAGSLRSFTHTHIRTTTHFKIIIFKLYCVYFKWSSWVVTTHTSGGPGFDSEPGAGCHRPGLTRSLLQWLIYYTVLFWALSTALVYFWYRQHPSGQRWFGLYSSPHNWSLYRHNTELC
jgi:hypothetical protein